MKPNCNLPCLISFLSTALVLGSLGAQSYSASYITPTGLKGYSKGANVGAKTFSLPAKSNLTKGYYAIVRSTGIYGTSFASTRVTYSRSSAGVLSARVSETVRRSSQFVSSTTGVHRTLLTLKAPRKITGTLVITLMLPKVSLVFWRFRDTASIDVGADNSWELIGRGSKGGKLTRSLPVTIGPSGLKVLTESGNRSSSVALTTNTIDLSVTFTPTPPTPFKFSSYGSTCGPVLGAKETSTHNASFSMSSSMPNKLGVLWIGTQSLNLKLPGTNCSLHTDPVFLFPMTLDARGRANWVLQIPEIRPFTFNAQVASLDLTALQMRLSSGITTLCPK